MKKSEIEETVLRAVRKKVYKGFEDKVELGTLLKDLDLDSLDCVEIIVELERVFGININEGLFYDVKVVDDLVKVLEGLDLMDS